MIVHVTDKQFTVAGISSLNGVAKVRFANDAMRVKALAKSGHTDILLIELPHAMHKVDAARFIAQIPEFENEQAQAIIDNYLAHHAFRSSIKRRGPRTVKATVEQVQVKELELA